MSTDRDDLSWPERITQALIQRAARRTGEPLAARLEEEWLADLTARGSAWARLRLALGCCWAGAVIGRESAALGAAAASPAGVRVLSAPAPELLGLLSRRTLAVLVIVALHGVVLYALAVGLGLVLHLAGPATTTQIEFLPDPVVVPAPPVRPPPLRGLRAPPVERVEPVHVVSDPPPQAARQPDGDEPPIATRVPPEEPLVDRVVGGPGNGFPRTDDFYPAAARRLGESGAALVRVCVDAAGGLAAAPALAQSSGSARLDEGALRLARAGSGHYRPTTENGRAVSYCYPLRVRFELHD
jgi:periplasmic protein TonB